MSIIVVSDISFSYTKKAPSVFNNFSWTVDRGDCVGILGHNGAGKTTLLKLLYGVLKPSHGEVQINVHDVASYREIFCCPTNLAWIDKSPFARTWSFGRGCSKLMIMMIWKIIGWIA